MSDVMTTNPIDTERLPDVAWNDPSITSDLLDAAIECGVITVAHEDGKQVYRYGGDHLGVGREHAIAGLIADNMSKVLYYATQPANGQPAGLCLNSAEVATTDEDADVADVVVIDEEAEGADVVAVNETAVVDSPVDPDVDLDTVASVTPADQQDQAEETVSAPVDQQEENLFAALVDDLISPDGKKRRQAMAAEVGSRLTILEAKARQESQLDQVVAEINAKKQAGGNQEHITSLKNQLAECLKVVSRHDRKQAELLSEAERNITLAEQAELATLKAMAGSYRAVAEGLQDQAAQSVALLDNAKSQITTLTNDIESDQAEAETALAAISEAGVVAVQAAQERHDKLLGSMKQDDPGAALFAQVMESLEERRHTDFVKLSQMVGSQANKDILLRAEKLDLGSYVASLKLLTSDRGRWISDITPVARRFCEALASGDDMQALRVTGGEGDVRIHPRAKFLILRAEKIAIVDANGWELTRIDFGPDSNPYFRSTQGRKWAIGNTDVWPLN